MAKTKTLQAGDAGRVGSPHGGCGASLVSKRAASRNHRPFANFDNERGFSLVEVVATITIAALAVVIAGQFWTSGDGSLKLGSKAQEIATTFQHARMSAIRRQTRTRVFIDVDARQIWSDSSGSVLELTPVDRITVRSASPERAGPSVAAIQFFPDGSSIGAAVRIEAKGLAYEIRIDWLSGRVSHGRAA